MSFKKTECKDKPAVVHTGTMVVLLSHLVWRPLSNIAKNPFFIHKQIH